MNFFFLLFTEHSMDQDLYGAYSKQQIESLTTDGEGEFTLILYEEV